MFGVAQLMLGLARMQASGTVDLRNAIGETGSVYLRIPAKGEGRGKVTVSWWTHAISGLHRNDFIMAARTDQLYE